MLLVPLILILYKFFINLSWLFANLIDVVINISSLLFYFMKITTSSNVEWFWVFIWSYLMITSTYLGYFFDDDANVVLLVIVVINYYDDNSMMMMMMSFYWPGQRYDRRHAIRSMIASCYCYSHFWETTTTDACFSVLGNSSNWCMFPSSGYNIRTAATAIIDIWCTTSQLIETTDSVTSVSCSQWLTLELESWVSSFQQLTVETEID